MSVEDERTDESADERMRILEMIESGSISAEQGMKLLEALNSTEDESTELESGEEAVLLLDEEVPSPGEAGVTPEDSVQPEAPRVDKAESPKLPPGAERWRRFWMIPLWIGVAITILGGYWMYRAQLASSVGWFICASMPFLLGVLVLVLAAQSRTAPWLHLRVQQKEGERPQRIAFSFPIPVRLTAWFLRTFGHRINALKDTAVDEIILALGTSTSPDNPLYIQVDEGDDEEKVEIYIG
jgi:hypothetical protein